MNIDGHDCVVFAEEYDPTAIAGEKKGADGRYVYHDDIIASWGKTGSLHLEGTEDSCLTMFSKITCCFSGYEDFLDEYVNLDLKDRIYGTFPALADKYEAVRTQFEKLRNELRPLWNDLPTSLFHPCEGKNRTTLIDGEGNLTGLRDFVDGGRDACISFFINRMMTLCEDLPEDHMAREVHNPTLRKARIDEFIQDFGVLRNHYEFTEAEIAAAPIIYKLWILFAANYFKGAVWKDDDESAAAAELDYILTLLTSDEADFCAICR